MKRIDLALLAMRVPLDASAIIGAALAAYGLRFAPWFVAYRPVTFTLALPEYLLNTLAITAVALLLFTFSGLYSPRKTGIAQEGLRIMVASAATMGVVLGIAVFSRDLFESRFILLVAWAMATFFLINNRISLRKFEHFLHRKGIGVQSVVIIGKTKAGNELMEWFGQHPEMGFHVTHHIAHFAPATIDRLAPLCAERKLDAVVLANAEAGKEEVLALKHFADAHHLAFFYCADLFPGSTLRPLVHTYAGRPVIEVPKTPLDGWGAIYKRLFDIFFSFLFILLTLPLQLMIAVCIFFESGRPIIFNIRRVGQGGRDFTFLKFRTMIAGAHALREDPSFLAQYGNERAGTPLFKLRNDPRITKVGRVLRAWSLDEIPQFYLVLWGSMSLVGPRPHLPEEVKKYRPEERKVLTVKPGITGMSQISGRASLDFTDEVALDMHYIENWSPWLDLIILAKTPLAVLSRKGAY